MQVIEYPVESVEETNTGIRVKAGIKQTDALKRIKYEGVVIEIPHSKKDFKEFVFAVTGIELKKDVFELILHAHVAEESDYCCEFDTRLPVSIDLLKSWTGLNTREIESAFRRISLGSTYNLLSVLPRTVIVTPKFVRIQTGKGKLVDSMNVCDLIFKNEHPIDR